MRLGERTRSHPSLPRRIAQLEPALGLAPQGTAATARALGSLASVVLVALAVGDVSGDLATRNRRRGIA